LAGTPQWGYPSTTGETDTSPKVLHHVVVVTGLSSGTTYYLRGISRGSPESASSEVTAQTTNPAPTTGSLTVTKNALGGNDTFSFTGGAGSFTITTIGGTNFNTRTGLVAGIYIVNESALAGWAFVDSDCDEAGVSVTAGNTSACTVTNAKQGRIIVKKVTIGGTGTFHFDASYNVNGFDLTGVTTGIQNDSGLLDPSIVTSEYDVSEDTPDGWTLTSAICDDGSDPGAITLDPNETVTCTFTNTKNAPTNQKGSISGIKFEDMNGNGIQDTGDKPLSGWTIYIDSNNNSKKDKGDKWTTTRKDGTYTFKNVAAGTYVIREVVKNHWIQTAPATGSFSVTLTSGQSVTGKNFGNFRLGRIWGLKFEDKNKNGVRDAGEKHLSGWTIQLKKGGAVVATTVTDKNGKYRFNDVAPGTYAVVEVQQIGWQQKTVNPAPIPMTSGMKSVNNNFGNAKI
jgi:hypothetical protein